MKNWRLWIGLSVSVLCLYLAARGIEFSSLLEALRQVQVVWLLLALGLFLFPMSLLSVIMFDSIAGLNPVLVIVSVASTLLPYIGLLLLLAVLVISIRLVVPLAIPLISGGNPFLSIGVFILYGSGIADFYLMMVLAHLLGRFYWKYQDKLYWEV